MRTKEWIVGALIVGVSILAFVVAVCAEGIYGMGLPRNPAAASWNALRGEGIERTAFPPAISPVTSIEDNAKRIQDQLCKPPCGSVWKINRAIEAAA